MHAGELGRGRERERERIPGRICTVSTGPDVGLELTNRDSMTRDEIKSRKLNQLRPPGAPDPKDFQNCTWHPISAQQTLTTRTNWAPSPLYSWSFPAPGLISLDGGISHQPLQALLSEPGSDLPPSLPRTNNKELRHIMEVSVVLWAFALTSWISDRLLCSFWQWINFFYLHSIW